MRSIVRLVLSFALLAATVSCSGNPPSPTGPSPLAQAPQAGGLQSHPASAADLPFTLGSVAPSLGQEINAVFLAAMLQGVPASGSSLNKLMREAIDALIGVKLEAQSGFVRNCSRAGNATVRHSGSTSGGTATLSNTEVIFSGCTYAWDNRTVTFHATLRATGTFRASRPGDPIHLEGDIRVDQLGGPFLLNGDTGPFLNGTIIPAPGATGGTPGETVIIGTPQTPAIPGAPTAPVTPPTTAPPTTPAPPTSGPPPVTVTPPTSAPIGNVTGTWGIDGQPAYSFVQNGGSLTGKFLLPEMPIPGIEIVSNVLHGFVGRNAEGGTDVHINGGITIRGGDSEGYMSIQVIVSGVFTLSGTSLIGRGMAQESRPSCTGIMVEFCPPPTQSSATFTLTRIGAVQSGTYDVSGRWSGETMIQLQQDGGGGIGGRVEGGDIAEQSVSGRNDSNHITLRVRYVTRENTSSVTYSRTVDRQYELTAYEPSSMGGFVTTVTTEQCTAKSSSAAAFCADRNKTDRTAGNGMLIRR